MPSFTQSHPELQLHLSSSTEPVDFNDATCDLAVRHFDGNARDIQAQLLLPDAVRIYCSPAYFQRMRLVTLDALPTATFLYTTSHAYWPQWFAAVGLTFEGFGSGLKFDQSELAIDAARRDQGLVLTSPWLVEEDVERGRLIPVFDSVLETGKGFTWSKQKMSFSVAQLRNFANGCVKQHKSPCSKSVRPASNRVGFRCRSSREAVPAQSVSLSHAKLKHQIQHCETVNSLGSNVSGLLMTGTSSLSANSGQVNTKAFGQLQCSLNSRFLLSEVVNQPQGWEASATLTIRTCRNELRKNPRHRRSRKDRQGFLGRA